MYSPQTIPLPKRAGFSVGALPNKGQKRKLGSALLVLSREGQVIQCNAAAARLFGGEPGDLEGSDIASFIPNLLPQGSSPSYSLRYLTYFDAQTKWQDFQAFDVDGLLINIEINLSRINAGGENYLLLNLRSGFLD